MLYLGWGGLEQDLQRSEELRRPIMARLNTCDDTLEGWWWSVVT